LIISRRILKKFRYFALIDKRGQSLGAQSRKQAKRLPAFPCLPIMAFMKTETLKVLDAAYESVRKYTACTPKVGIVLGSGLSGIASTLAPEGKIDFSLIEGFPKVGVSGHAGALFYSESCAVMAGRFHYYEGHALDTVVLPILLLKRLGVETLILTNAAGGIHYSLGPGDLALISDHINFQGTNALIGPHSEAFGPRFPDMSEVYSQDLRTLARGFDPFLKEGVYAAFPGPCYETPAEIRMLRAMGADIVGMSTVPEATMAASVGLKVLGISIITNFAAGLSKQKLDHKEVLEYGKKAEDRLASLLTKLVQAL